MESGGEIAHARGINVHRSDELDASVGRLDGAHMGIAD
jgi:hypothetical protein